MFLADRALREGNLGLARATLAAHIPAPGHPMGAEDFRGFEWRLLWEQSQGEQLRVLTGFPRPPSALAISPDGRTLAIAGSDYLWRWNLDESTGAELLPPKEPRWLAPEEAAKVLSRVRMTPLISNQVGGLNPTPDQIAMIVNPERLDLVTGLSFSLDGRQVVSSSRQSGRAARVWNMADGRIEFAFPALHSSAVMSPVAPIVAVGSCASPNTAGVGFVKLYDLEQRAEIWELPEFGGLVGFSGDGQLLVTVGWNSVASTGQITLWSLPERRLVKQFGFTKSWYWNILGFSPNGRWVALAEANSPTIELWSVEKEQLVRELTSHAGAIRALAFSPDSELLASAGVDQVIRLWSVTSGELTATRSGHIDEVASLAFFPHGQRLASASRDGTVRLWSTTASDRETLEPQVDGLWGRPMISQNSRWLTSSSQSSAQIKLWDTRSGSAWKPEIFGVEAIQSEGFDDGGESLVSSVYSGNQHVDLEWRSLEDFTVTRTVSLDGKVDFDGMAVRSFSAAGGLFALGQADGRVRVWSTRTGSEMKAFTLPDLLSDKPVHANMIQGLAISPDGRLLAAGIRNHSQIGVFSMPDARMLYSHHTRPLSTVTKGDRLSDPGDLAFLAFSPDNKLLVTTDLNEPGIRLWEARTGREVAWLSGHRDHTVAVAFSPDGRTLASTGGDGSLKLWHLPTRRELATLLESDAVGPAVFSPDGSMLIVGLNNLVRIFRAPPLAENRER